jgi:hypothetical protein
VAPAVPEAGGANDQAGVTQDAPPPLISRAVSGLGLNGLAHSFARKQADQDLERGVVPQLSARARPRPRSDGRRWLARHCLRHPATSIGVDRLLPDPKAQGHTVSNDSVPALPVHLIDSYRIVTVSPDTVSGRQPKSILYSLSN